MAKVKQIRCPCKGQSGCKLCGGTGIYGFEPGPRGYMPFECPNCGGQKILSDDDGDRYACPTCKGEGRVDPANPPMAGLWDVLTKIMFGA